MDRNIDWNAFAEFLIDRYVPGPATLFRSIKKLPPGSVGIWENGRLAVSRYFTPPIASVRPDVKSLADAAELFTVRVRRSGTTQDAKRRPVRRLLVGGIDLSAVVAAMTRHSRESIRTFSVGFAEAEYSELAYARTVSELYRTHHHELEVTAQDYFDSWPEALLRRGAPVSEPADIPILLLSRMARESVKMVLTGEGSDELLAGYPKHIAESWVSHIRRLFRPRSMTRLFVLQSTHCPTTHGELRSLRARWANPIFAVACACGLVVSASPSGLKSLSRRHSNQSIDHHPFSLAQGSALRRTLFFDQTSWLPDNLLEGGDRMMMAGSIEGRMPFLDVELARVVARFPDRFLTGHRERQGCPARSPFALFAQRNPHP